jgi:hypothetical protein
VYQTHHFRSSLFEKGWAATVAPVDHAASKVFDQTFSQKVCVFDQTFFEKVCGQASVYFQIFASILSDFRSV